MDTTQKTREPQRRPQTAQEPRKRPASAKKPSQAAQSAARPRPAQVSQGKVSAPQGTGPRKSAPKPREQAAAPKRTAPATRKPAARKKNPLKSLITNVQAMKNADPQDAITKRRQKKRAAEAARKRRRAQMHDTPAVIYTAPQPFNRSRLLVQLLTVVAVVLALIMGLSVFFKVDTITVSGAEHYSTWKVREASGIQEGDNLLTFSIPRASGQIIAKLSYVDQVRIGIKLPDTVNIYIEERDVAYAIKDTEGTWWLMSSDGKMLEQANSAIAASHTQVLGVTVVDPMENERAVAVDDIPTETMADGELVPITVTGAQRLSAVLQILKALEANDIVGDAASVDVTRLEDIILWYGTRYQVNLGNTADMEYKIACMNDAILQLSDYQTGVLDVSFTTWPDQVGYTPFS